MQDDICWPVQAKHLGKTHFNMEITGGPSRWNPLWTLRVLKPFGFLYLPDPKAV